MRFLSPPAMGLGSLHDRRMGTGLGELRVSRVGKIEESGDRELIAEHHCLDDLAKTGEPPFLPMVSGGLALLRFSVATCNCVFRGCGIYRPGNNALVRA